MCEAGVAGAVESAVRGDVSRIDLGSSAVESDASACALITGTYAREPGEPEG
ncbi:MULTISPECIES: hypothetical protein [unclassified Haloferax]|uniref:hypothetical protein n=1 Tax=unclassified Haloferax TaxID=2625095 RepID=UPI0013140451|nr:MULTISPECIES: hypothetical protein [unclassified Haloferax]